MMTYIVVWVTIYLVCLLCMQNNNNVGVRIADAVRGRLAVPCTLVLKVLKPYKHTSTYLGGADSGIHMNPFIYDYIQVVA